MIYDVRLTISHRYEQTAGNGRHAIRVLPKWIEGRQSLTAHLLEVSPFAEERWDGIDFFGNAKTTVTHIDPHNEMIISMTCRVDLSEPQKWFDVSTDVMQLRAAWQSYQGLENESPLHYLGPSPRLSLSSEIVHFAEDVFDPQASAAANVILIGEALHREMTFDAKATDVDTDASVAFRIKRGVCQDFTHIMILALQSLGIPAGYVSGYLRTLPPPGQARLEGVDAMHAWVRAWCGAEQGWIEYDPTNAKLAGSDHIVVGYGRDYSDVPPVIGRLRSSGKQTNSQSVDVALVS